MPREMTREMYCHHELLWMIDGYEPERGTRVAGHRGYFLKGNAVLLNQAMKFAIQRPRPDVLRLVDVSGFSFPSGHSMAAMAVFGLLAWCVWRYERNPRRRIALMCLFALVIVMVGISRIYLGVHYASDVLGGFCVSTIWLVLYTKVIAPALGLIE